MSILFVSVAIHFFFFDIFWFTKCDKVILLESAISCYGKGVLLNAPTTDPPITEHRPTNHRLLAHRATEPPTNDPPTHRPNNQT